VLATNSHEPQLIVVHGVPEFIIAVLKLIPADTAKILLPLVGTVSITSTSKVVLVEV
jgi:hypothetical protein